MRYQRTSHQYDLFSDQADLLTADTLPEESQLEAILLLARLLSEIVQVEMKTRTRESRDE